MITLPSWGAAVLRPYEEKSFFGAIFQQVL